MSLDEEIDEVRPSNLLDALKHLEAVALVPARQRYTDAGQLAKQIATFAYEGGVSPAALERLLKLLTRSNALDQGTLTTLVKNLYPSERIASKLVTQVVCCLGPTKNKPSPATQALLLRWLILVYDLLEDRSHLSKLYAVLFNHLDMLSLRKPLCHLLSFITRRKHVKPFRIQALMELVASSGGDDRELISLLRVFKNYYPDVIVGDPGRKGLFFKHPDPEWASHVRQLQEANLEHIQGSRSTSFQVVHRGLVKRSKVEAIVPDVQTSRVAHNRTSLEELRGVDHFIERLEKIELPNQIISTIADGLAQKYIFLAQPELANRRLNDWLEGFLGDQLEYAQDFDDEGVETLGYVLALAVSYARYSKTIPDAFISFLKSYIPAWNGVDNRDQILELLEYLPISNYDVLRADILAPLEAAFQEDTASSKAALLNFYSSLIRQWGVKLRAAPFTSEKSQPLSQLISHAELLALAILESPPEQPSEQDTNYRSSTLSVIAFHFILADLFSYAHLNGNIRITVPLAPTVYSLVFTSMSSVISDMNSILASYKSSFEASMTSEALQGSESSDMLYSQSLVGQFNGYIMDICNLVWRNRALNGEDPNALGCLIPVATITALMQYIRDVNERSRKRNREAAFSYTIASVFSLSHHAALSNMSASCFADLEKDSDLADDKPRLRKPVTQKALSALEKDGGIQMTWQDYRVRMLDWMEAAGSNGIAGLMRTTMKALRKE
ncbi:Mis6-domain-containing protein [Aspergillus pseudodeflectus]|uniref:Mis6-domain-containing protein n=1 Tax=Aspergillus pseudodeflectus TaxID=176178 RepID=A0ABR4JXA0_9EURO